MNYLIFILIALIPITVMCLFFLLASKHKNMDLISYEIDENVAKKTAVKGIISYAIIFFIVATILSTIITLVYLSINNIDIAIFDKNNPSYNEALAKSVESKISLILQLAIYIIATSTVCLVMRAFLIKDFHSFTMKNIVTGAQGVLWVYLANIAGTLFLLLVGQAETSSNQDAINQIIGIGNIGLFGTALFTILLAPVVEELVFRKCFFTLLSNKSVVAQIIISSVLFGLLHVISPTIIAIQNTFAGKSSIYDIYVELVHIVPYLLMGAALGYTYVKSNYNIYSVIIAHLLMNAIATLMIGLQF